MAIISGPQKCAAFGCGAGLDKKTGLFCKPHFGKLPEILRGPSAAREAVVYLAKAEGFLVEQPRRAPIKLTDNKGSEYV